MLIFTIVVLSLFLVLFVCSRGYRLEQYKPSMSWTDLLLYWLCWDGARYFRENYEFDSWPIAIAVVTAFILVFIAALWALQWKRSQYWRVDRSES